MGPHPALFWECTNCCGHIRESTGLRLLHDRNGTSGNDPDGQDQRARTAGVMISEYIPGKTFDEILDHEMDYSELLRLFKVHGFLVGWFLGAIRARCFSKT